MYYDMECGTVGGGFVPKYIQNYDCVCNLV